MPSSSLDIDYLRRLATRLFTDGQYDDADQVLAELATLNEDDNAQIALRRAQIGMLGDRMADVAQQLDLARDRYGEHVYFVGLEADMALRNGDLSAASAALRRLSRHARAQQLESFDGDWYVSERLSRQPVAWDDDHALPLFDVTVNGHTGRFILDTGTGDCLLDAQFAARAGVELGHHDVARFAGGRVGQWRVGRIDALSLGDSRFTQLPAMAAPLRDAFRHVGDGAVDGIVGANLVRAAGGIELDYRCKNFRLGSPGIDDGAALWIAGSHYPLVACRVNGGAASSWFIDSGMSGMDLACSASAARRHGAQPIHRNVKAQGGGGVLGAGAVLVRHFQHADLVYDALPAAVLPGFNLGRELGLRIGGIIGHDWLARHRVRLDYRAMQVSIELDGGRAA